MRSHQLSLLGNAQVQHKGCFWRFRTNLAALSLRLVLIKLWHAKSGLIRSTIERRIRVCFPIRTDYRDQCLQREHCILQRLSSTRQRGRAQFRCCRPQREASSGMFSVPSSNETNANRQFRYISLDSVQSLLLWKNSARALSLTCELYIANACLRPRSWLATAAGRPYQSMPLMQSLGAVLSVRHRTS